MRHFKKHKHNAGQESHLPSKVERTQQITGAELKKQIEKDSARLAHNADIANTIVTNSPHPAPPEYSSDARGAQTNTNRIVADTVDEIASTLHGRSNIKRKK